MKSHTDIKQSKILAEILPHESADMHYKVNRHNNESKIVMIPSYSELGYYKNNDYQYSVCAWSLAALISIIPKRINKDGGLRFRIDIDETDTAVWYEDLSSGLTVGELDITDNNSVDACYKIILKLHELNLL